MLRLLAYLQSLLYASLGKFSTFLISCNYVAIATQIVEEKRGSAIAHQADTDGICEKINTWENHYQEFASPIITLANEFKVEEIEELLQQYLSSET